MAFVAHTLAKALPRTAQAPAVARKRGQLHARRGGGTNKNEADPHRSDHNFSWSSGGREPWTPERDPDYVEGLIHGFATESSCRQTSALVRPVNQPEDYYDKRRNIPLVLKVPLASYDADYIQAAVKSEPLPSICGRPSTSLLFLKMMDSLLIVITKVALTQPTNRSTLFKARIWTRAPDSLAEVAHDVEPADALILATACRAPIFINQRLMERNRVHDLWGAHVDLVHYHETARTTSSLHATMKMRPEHPKIAKLRMAIDLANRTNYFATARRLTAELHDLCPVDALEQDLRAALDEERYHDAARLRDELCRWRLKIAKWK